MDYIKNNKTITLVIVGVIVLLFGWNMFSGSRNSTGLNINKSGTGTTTYSDKDGSVSVGGNKYPDNWPTDAPKYANATIEYSAAANPQTGGAASSVIFLTTSSAQAVADFYKKELMTLGWTVEQVANTGGTMVITAKKDTRTFAVYIVDSGDGQVTVTVGIELGK